MAHYILLAFLIAGGFTGWSLFFYTFVKTLLSRQKELEVIDEISKELKKVKQELQELK